MVCKKCGYDIQKGWKYCPNCRLKLKTISVIPGIVIIIIVSIIGFGASIIYELTRPVDEKYIKEHLEDKYDEIFKEIELVDSIKNEDKKIGCDGSTGIIPGRGETEYYKVYSNKNDLEFFAIYDNSDGFKIIKDTYDEYLSRVNSLEKIYNKLNDYFQKDITKIFIRNSLNDEKIEISSFEGLKNEVTLYNIEDAKKFSNNFFEFEDDMYVYIEKEDLDFIDFYKENEEKLEKIKEIVSEVNEDNQYYINLEIILNDNYTIGFRDNIINVKTRLSDYMTIDEYVEEY